MNTMQIFVIVSGYANVNENENYNTIPEPF